MLSRIKESNHLLDIIDNINSMFLHTNAILLSFDIVNMFPNIDNKSGLDAVKSVLLKGSTNTPSVECILEGSELCLICNNSIFNNRDFLQTDGTAQGPHMSCSYSDIAMSKFDTAALQYHFQPTLWKRFRDDILTIWTHGSDTLESFLDYLNQIDSTGKIKFTMQVQDEDGIEFLDLKLKLENSKIAVDAFAKPTNSFTYVLPTSRYTRRSLNNIPRGIALRLGCICGTDEKFNSR